MRISIPVLVCFSMLSVSQSLGQSIFSNLKLLANDSDANDGFGSAIAIENNLVAIGASADEPSGFGSGSAYVFDMNSDTQLVKLRANDGAPLDAFGTAIDLANGIVVVGAPNNDARSNNAGAAYLFDALTGTQLFELFPTTSNPQANFGSAVAIDNTVVAIAAKRDRINGTNSGAVYLFNPNTGIQTATLLPNDPSVEQKFGASLALDNGIIAIGATGDSENGPLSGAVYIYNYAGVQLAKIYPDDGLPNQRFGFSVDISQGILAVGAPGQSTNGQEAGAAYIFNTNTNEQLFQLFPNFPAEFDNFGYAIALQDQYAAIGAKYSGPGLGSVDAYVFDTIAGYQIVRLRQGGNAAGSIFGATLDIQDDIVWVTDPRDDQGGSNAGAAYRFNFICTPDLTGDFNLDFFDISAFLNAFTGSDPIADFNGDGLYNFFDISLFLNAFIAGCP